MPETREEVGFLLTVMLAWLRDLSMTASASAVPVIHAGQAEALRHQALTMNMDRCVETAFELVALQASLEQFISPRLVAALAREKWLSLLEGTREVARSS